MSIDTTKTLQSDPLAYLVAAQKARYAADKALDDAKLGLKVKDLSDVLTGLRVGDVVRLEKSDKGNPVVVIGDPAATGKVVWSNNGDFGYAAVNAVGDLMLLQSYQSVIPGYHTRLYDASEPSVMKVAYQRLDDGYWVCFNWYGHRLVPAPILDEEHYSNMCSLHAEMDVILEVVQAGGTWKCVFPGSNGPRFARRIEEVLEMTLSEARQRKAEDFKLAYTAGILQDAPEVKFDPTQPLVVDSIDFTKLDPLPKALHVTFRGMEWDRPIKDRENMLKYLANNQKLIDAGAMKVTIVS